MKGKPILLALVALVAATWVVAQQLPYSNSPTDKDYKLRIREPQPDATITGKDLTIVMSEPFVPSGAGVNEKEQRAMLTPSFQIWIDGKDYGKLPHGNNVFTAHDLSYGPHKVVVVALNVTNEVVDRKEFKITTIAPAETTASTTVETRSVAVETQAPPPPPQPVASAPPPPEPAPAPMPETLPQTASSAPGMAAAGMLLFAAGLALRRRR
jgi:LPXTG-motif cell wall-anchored protein